MNKKLLIIVLAVIGIVLIGGWWIWSSQEDSGIVVGKEINVIGEIKSIHGFVPQAICTECFGLGKPYEIKSNGKCCYWFDYFDSSPYYIGDIMNETVKIRAIIKKTQSCPSPIQLPCDRLYLEPIKIEILEKTEATITTDKTEYEQGETVKIMVKNNLDKNICLGKNHPYYSEKWNEETKKWEIAHPELLMSGVVPSVGECINSKEHKEFISDDFFKNLILINSGKYRILFPVCVDCEKEKNFNSDKTICSNEFTIKEKEKIDETSDWKIYRNEEYGFKIKYPKSLLIKTEIEKDLFYINFCISSENWPKGYSKELTLHISSNKEKLSLRDALAKRYDFSDLQFMEVQTENNLQALKPLKQTSEDYWKQFPMGSGLEYNYWFIGNQNFIFGVNHWQDSQLDSETLVEIADQMLSTFRFIE